jgi:cell division protein FtsQ
MHLRINKKIFIYIFLILILGSINNKNLHNIKFSQITSINIEGLSEKENSKLIESLEIFKMQNLFFLDKNKITEILNSNNLIEDFFIFKKYPSSLEIKIKKTEFLAKVIKSDKTYYLGSNGKLILLEKKESKLPFIFGEFKNKDFFDLYEVIDDTNFDFNKIKKLFFFNSGRWDIETYSGVLIKLPKEKFKQSFNISLKILNNDKFKEIKIIDLRQNNQVIING